MAESWRKLVFASIICYVIAFLIVGVVSITRFSLETVEPVFQVRWIVMNTLSEFLSIMPVAQAWAVLITFSLIVPLRSSGMSGTSFERFGSSIIVLLVLTLIFSVVYGVVHPLTVRSRDDLEFSSTVARRLLDSAEESLDKSDFERARIDLEQYTGIVGESDKTVGMMSRIRRGAEQDAARLSQNSATTQETSDGPAGARALADRAAAALEDEDYSNAHYLATLARSLDPENEDAARIAADALGRLGRSVPDGEENAQAELFGEIQAAKESLDRGDIVSAYYMFTSLAEQHPGNTDVARYLAEVSVAVRDLSIFTDELQSVQTMPGTSPFVFVNDEDEESIELIAIGKLVRLPAGTYARDLEVMRFSRDGGLLYQLRSDFGKMHEGSMILTVNDPESRDGERRPVVTVDVLDRGTENLVALTPTADELWRIGVASANPAGAAIPGLVRVARSANRFGLTQEPVQAELLYRLSLPFLFLILNLLVLGFSWRFRSRYISRPPVVSFFVVPLAPLALLPVYLLLRHAHRLLSSTLLLWTQLTPAIVLLLVVEAILLAASLTYLALSARE